MGSIIDAIGGLFGANSQAHNAQKGVSDFQNATAGSTAANQLAFTNQTAAYQPIYDIGLNGLKSAAAMQTPGYQYNPSDPSYAWRRDQGLDAANRGAAAAGTLNSGGQLKALERYGQGLASTEFANDFARNNTLAGYGTQGAQGLATANANYATNTGNALFNGARGTSAGRTQQGDATAAEWGQGANLVTSVGKFFGF